MHRAVLLKSAEVLMPGKIGRILVSKNPGYHVEK